MRSQGKNIDTKMRQNDRNIDKPIFSERLTYTKK